MQFSVVISRFTQPHADAANYNITDYCNFFLNFSRAHRFSTFFFFSYRIEFFKETIIQILINRSRAVLQIDLQIIYSRIT